MKCQLVIAPAAKSDIKSIYEYSLEQWGKAQAESYLATLKDQLWALTKQPQMGTERTELFPGVRSLTLKSHTIFYRIATNSIQVIRVLHSRQDPLRQLKKL